MHAIGVDIGGTKIAVGVVDDLGRIVAKVRRQTQPDDPSSIDRAIAEAVTDLRREYEVTAVGVAAAGFVSADRNHVLFAPNIAWRDYPLAERVSALIEGDDVTVVVDNDGNAAGWAEFVYGAGADATTMVMLTIGTGLGAAIVVDGNLVRGAYGFAAELGHVRVVPDGFPCGCGHRGCWEQYASGSALVRDARTAVHERPGDAATLLEAAGGDALAITGPMVTAAAHGGDPLSVELLSRLGTWIGAGCASMAAVFDPEVFVVGGGVASAGDLLISPANAAYLEHLPARGHRPVAPVVAAAMGNDAGMVGAAALARHAVQNR